MLKQDVILKKLNNIEELLKKQSDQFLTLEEAAKYLNLAKSYIYKLTHRGLIPHYKPRGKQIYFSKAELDAWVFKGKVKDNSEVEQEAVDRVSM